MEKILDLLGANIIWGFLLLIIINVNSQMNDFSFESLNTSITQMDAVELTRIIESDFQKAGSLISGNKIVIADSDHVKFYFDNHNDGSQDFLNYYLGNKSDLYDTANPHDMEVYRNLNDTVTAIGNITDFKIEYLDSLGQIISYASLQNQTSRNNIKIFRISILKEGQYPNYDSLYPAIEWTREIRPKNL